MATTIKDIANACHVSKATVSRYINGSGYVSAEVAAKIATKIREMNYVPSATARNLSNRKNNVIGVVIPEVSNPFFGEVFKGISQIAEEHNLNIFYCDTDNSAEKEMKALAMLRSYEIQGIILTPAAGGMYKKKPSQEFIDGVKALNVPVILLDRDVPYVNWDGVFIDNYRGAYESTKCLIEAGHTEVATIAGDLSLMIGRERLRGYTEAMQAHGLQVREEFIYPGDFTTKTAYNIMIDIIDSDNRPTAIFSPNNLTTLGILQGIFQKGLRIPEDIAIVGFDDIDVLTTLHINLTVIKRDNIKMGIEAMNLLYARMNETENAVNAEPLRIVMEPEIIYRGSEKKM